MPQESRLQIGDVIGGYEVVAELTSENSPGEVYLCRLVGTQELIVLKGFRNLRDKTSLHDQLRMEVRHWLKMGRHPNIVFCYGMEYLDGVPYILLEWVPGDTSDELTQAQNLSSLLEKEGKLDVQTALKLSMDICRGLCHAQLISRARGLVHGDLKPDNILVTPTIAKITDFGLSFLVDTAQDLITNEAQIPLYKPPEQLLAKSIKTPHVDIYAFGCILYEILTGNHPFGVRGERATPREIARRHLESPVPVIGNLEKYPTEGINAIVSRCMAKNPADRFQHPNEILMAIAQYYERHIGTMPNLPSVRELTAQEHLLIGLTYDYMLRIDERDSVSALIHLNKAIQLAPNAPIMLVHRGVFYADRGEFQKALADYQNAISTYELALQKGIQDQALIHDAALAYYNRAELYNHHKDFRRALNDYNRSIELQLKYPELFSGRAIAYQTLKLGDTYNERGNLCIELGRYENAIADYERAIEFAPDDPELHYNLGVTYYELKKYDAAIKALDTAIKIPNWNNQGFGKAFYNRALAHIYAHNYETAIKDLEKAIELLKKGELRGNMWMDKLASAQRGIVLETKERLFKAYSNIAFVYEEQGQYGKALETYDEAIIHCSKAKLTLHEANVHMRKARLLIETGRESDAEPHIKQAENLGFPMAKEIIKQALVPKHR